GLRLGRTLVGATPYPRDHGRSVCSADAEFSIDRAIGQAFQQADASPSAKIRRGSCSGARNSSARPCRRRHCPGHLSTISSSPYFARFIRRILDSDRLRPAHKIAGAISRRELERGRRPVRSSARSAAPPGLASSRIRDAGHGSLRKGNSLSPPQRTDVAHPDHADFYVAGLPLRLNELRPAFQWIFDSRPQSGISRGCGLHALDADQPGLQQFWRRCWRHPVLLRGSSEFPPHCAGQESHPCRHSAGEIAVAWIAVASFYGRPALNITIATFAGLLFAAPMNFAVGNVLSIYSPKKLD